VSAPVDGLPPPPVVVVVVMGVSGSGKTTVASMLAGRLHWPFAEADDFHPPENIAKMHAGIPLDDEDRLPWLRAIAAQIDHWRAAGENGVITCSALKRRYREIIIGARPEVRLVYLKGELEIIHRRMVARHGHFMPASLLRSQFDTLEEPTPDERPIVVPVDQPPAAQVQRILAALTSPSASNPPPPSAPR
jgi:gluconokinase